MCYAQLYPIAMVSSTLGVLAAGLAGKAKELLNMHKRETMTHGYMKAHAIPASPVKENSLATKVVSMLLVTDFTGSGTQHGVSHIRDVLHQLSCFWMHYDFSRAILWESICVGGQMVKKMKSD